MTASRGTGLRVGAAAVVVGMAVLAVAFSSRFGRDPQLVESPLLGRPVPELALPLLDGSGEVDLADLRGDIVVVNFFASWCLQCRSEHAALVSTADAFADAGVRFVGVSYQDDADDTRAFLDELGRSEATLYATDPGSRAAIAFGVFGVPETYFVDPDGVLVGKIQGESNAALLGETIDRIRRGEDPGSRVVGDVQASP